MYVVLNLPLYHMDNTGVVDECFESKNTLNEMYDLDKAPSEESCDVFMHEESPSLGFDVLPYPLDHSHDSPSYSLDITLMCPLVIL